MFIYIVRHAWAYEHGDPRWPDDSKRPLEDEGAARFAEVVKALAPRGFEPAAIATSPYVRCRQTAEIAAAHVPGSPKVVELDVLKPGSDFEACIEWTAKQPQGASVAWCGHAPDVSFLAAALIGDGGAEIRFAKGAVAAIRVEGELGVACGELHWLATAKSLGV
jgi:phosphohistidine phosphatase